MADTVLGKVSCVPRGDYNAGTTYYALDIVGYQGGSYMGLKESTGVTPSNDQVNWMQLSGPGLPGADGTDGTDGVTFTPSVSEAGVISWTNDGGEDNPDPVNIMGPQGNPGAAAGFGEATATVDETTGTPSVEVETSGPDTAKVFSFAFSGLKGETGEKGDPGDQGIQGVPGVAAGFGTPTATVDDNVGTPGVTVQASGPDTAKVFSFAFVNLKGETGAQGIQGEKGDPGTSVQSIQRTSGTGAAGTTDTYTMYDSEGEVIGTFTVYNGSNGTGSGDFMANGTVPMTGQLNMGGNRVTNVGAPTAGTDAVRQSDLQAVSDEVDHILDGTTPVAIPAATEAKVGGIKPGTGLEVEADGTANVTLTGVPDGGTTGQILTQGASGPEWEDAPDTGVTKFNGRTGEVEPQEGDYTASMVGARPDTWTPSASDVGAIPASEKGAASGVAELDSTGKVPASQLPEMDYIPTDEKGAASGVATLDSNGKLAGSQKPTYTASEVGAIASPSGGSMGQVLTKTSSGVAWDDVPSDLPSGGTDGQILAKTADGVAWEDAPEAGVTSFKGRTGAVTPQDGDYTADMVGARPDTWTPSAEDVGARPDTWTPSADDVGAMPAVSGGTTGQVLTKTASGQEWQNPPAGGITQDQADARYLQLSGGTMTGDLNVSGQNKVKFGSGYGFTMSTSGNFDITFSRTNSAGEETSGGVLLENVEVLTPSSTDTNAIANVAYVNRLKPTRLTATLSASGWSGNSQTITVNGVITNTSAQDIDISCADKASADAWAAGGVWCSNPTTANRLTFTCTTAPTANINLNIRLWEVG